MASMRSARRREAVVVGQNTSYVLAHVKTIIILLHDWRAMTETVSENKTLDHKTHYVQTDCVKRSKRFHLGSLEGI
jgi:hypothetical protein